MDWRPIETAPKDGAYVLLLFEDDDIVTAQHDGDAGIDGHNGWWTRDGLDFGYGHSNPIGWLPRSALPPNPKRSP